MYGLRSTWRSTSCNSACHGSPPAGVFSPGQPAAFHHNYLAGAALLAAVEGMGRNRKAVERCRGSAAAASWAKRWNLAVYFSLLYQDIAGEGCFGSMLCLAAGWCCSIVTSWVVL